jgi:flagellar basal-body rod protein FlgF
MDRLLYVAMSGAKQIMQAQELNANNLANAATTGFRADLAAMKALPVYGPGYASRVYVQAQGGGVDVSQGSSEHTGRAMDVVVKGKGWIAVQAPDGTEAYTRAGNLHVTETGQLLTGDNLPVLGNGGPIAIPPAQKIDIGTDGTVSIVPQGQQAQTLAAVDRIKLVKLDGSQLTKTADGLLKLRGGASAAPDASITLATGALESSNVNGIKSMISMIDLSRQYELQLKVMKTAQDNADASAQMMQMN